MGKNLIRRGITDYDRYVYLQGGKARDRKDKILAISERARGKFRGWFESVRGYMNHGQPMLCLGARCGAEIRGAVGAGFPDSVGIDLHPISEIVIQGDWHDLPFDDDSFQNVFSNSLDHCGDLDKLASEIRRVLTRSGRFFLMAPGGAKFQDVQRRMREQLNEFLFWVDPDHLADFFQQAGMTMVYRVQYDSRWHGYVFGCGK